MAVSKKLRFEVFKRDAFTCQYCGRKAPDVVLQVDHIKPKSKGGTDDILNLVTSCSECNLGKSNRELSDHEVMRHRRQQLEELQERKEQLEMMFEWQQGLLDLEAQTLAGLEEYWTSCTHGYQLNDLGQKDLKQLARRFEPAEITEAMRIATEQYLEYDGDRPTLDSVNLAWRRVGGICRNRRLQQENPELARLAYIRGILRNRLSWFDAPVAMHLLHRALDVGGSIESLEAHAKAARSWSQWRRDIEEFIESHEGE